MTTEDARTSPSLTLARRIAALGLLASILAVLAPPAGAGTTERVSVDSAGNQVYRGSSGPPGHTSECIRRHHRAGQRGQRREPADR